jgi:hemolysin activation/secretion protein
VSHHLGVSGLASSASVRIPLVFQRLTLISALAMACTSWAQVTPPAPIAAPDPAPEQRRQQERERIEQERQQQSVDVRSAVPEVSLKRLPTGESPCFEIKTITLRGEASQQFQWLLGSLAGVEGKDAAYGQCIGAQGVNVLLTRAQDALVARGYVTSRVLAEPQDLKTGSLALTLIPGRLRAIRFATPPKEQAGSVSFFTTRYQTQLWNSFSGQVGGILNLRDIEQTLENLKRVPTAEADFKIEPAEGLINGQAPQPGESDVVITYSQTRPVRGAVSLDDSGSKGTGKRQGSFTLSWDNPAAISDLFYATFNHDAGGGEPGARGTKGYTVHYSVPYGYWLLSTTHSRSRYFQTVAGASQDYVYSGTSANGDIKLSRLVYRDALRKTTLSARAFARRSNNYIDDTEVEVQRRKIGGWELGASHKEFIGAATLDASLNYKRGTGAFGSLASPEDLYGEGTSRFKLVTTDVNLSLPFKVSEQALRYSGSWRTQWNRSPLTPQDRFAIGGRYSVRGFDGESSLSSERGWTLRNELSTVLGQTGQEAYFGLDYGRVGGPSSQNLVGTSLAGSVVGLRGGFQGLQYDIFVGTPIKKPKSFGTSSYTAGFSLNYSF